MGASRRGSMLFAAWLLACLGALAFLWLREEARAFDAWAEAVSVRTGEAFSPASWLALSLGGALHRWREDVSRHGWRPPLRLWLAALAALGWLGGAHVLGEAVARRLLGRDPGEDFPRSLCLPLGFAVSGAAILGLSLLAIHWLLFGVVLAVGARAGLWRALGLARRLEPRKLWREKAGFLNVGTAVFLGLSFVYAFQPATQSDGMRYHLGALSEWIKAGRLTFLPHLSFAQFPFLVELNWLPGLAATGDPLAGGVFAKAVHWGLFAWTLGVLSSLAEALLGPEASPESRALARRLARFAWASVPCAAIVAGWSFIDHGVTLFFVATILALGWAIRGEGGPPFGRALLAGLVAGGLLGTKYTMLAPAGLAGAWLLAAAWARGGRSLRAAARAGAAFALGAALLGGPWFAKNALLAGNPIYPATAGGLFESPGWPKKSADLLRQQMDRKGLVGGADGSEPSKPGFATAWAASVTHWRSFEAQFLGLGFPLSMLALAGLGAMAFGRKREEGSLAPRRQDAKKEGREGQEEAREERPEDSSRAWLVGLCLLQGAAFYVAWLATYRSARMLMPLAALASVVPGVAAARFSGESGRWARRTILGAWGLTACANLLFLGHWLLIGQFPNSLGPALGFAPAEARLGESLNSYELAVSLNALQGAESLGRLPADAPGALLIGEHRPYYFNGRVVFADWYNPPAVAELLAESPGDVAALLEGLLADGVEWIAFNEAEFSQYAPLFFELWLDREQKRTLLSLLDAGQRGGLMRAESPRNGRWIFSVRDTLGHLRERE